MADFFKKMNKNEFTAYVKNIKLIKDIICVMYKNKLVIKYSQFLLFLRFLYDSSINDIVIKCENGESLRFQRKYDKITMTIKK